MLRQAIALIIAALLLALCGLSDAGQYCVIDPPRAASARTVVPMLKASQPRRALLARP
jgi:hypothetical protein